MSQFMNYQDEQCKILQAKLDDIFAKKFTLRERSIPVFTSILMSSSWKSGFDFSILNNNQQLGNGLNTKVTLTYTPDICADVCETDFACDPDATNKSFSRKQVDFETNFKMLTLCDPTTGKEIRFEFEGNNPLNHSCDTDEAEFNKGVANCLMQLDEQVQKFIISKAMEFAVLPTDCAKTTLKVPFFIQNQVQPQLPLPNPRLASTIEYQYYHARLTQGRKYLFGGWALKDYLSYAQNTSATDNGFGNQSWSISDMINAQVNQAFDSILPEDTMLISEPGAFQLLYRPLYVTPESRRTYTPNVKRYNLRLPSGLPVNVEETFSDEQRCSKRTISFSVLLDFAQPINYNCDLSPCGNGLFLIENCAPLNGQTCP
jgi:hypothetical protein